MHRVGLVALLMVAGCQGPKGDMGDPGAPGMNGITPMIDFAGVDQAGADFAGVVQPQAITCTPGVSFCATTARVATCTLSGADAVLGQDCGTAGSATNPATCVATGCPAGQAACCRRMKQLWKWNFTQPAVVGEAFIAAYDSTYLQNAKSCTPSGLGIYYAALNRITTACPNNGLNMTATFDRATVNVGTTVTLPSAGNSLGATVNGVTCYTWSGTAKIDSDVPDWSVTINATCTEAGKTSLQVVGTMSGSE